MYVELGICKDDGHSGLRVQFDSSGFITSSHTSKKQTILHTNSPIISGDRHSYKQKELETPSMVLDVSWWKYEDGNTVNLVGSRSSNKKTRLDNGGRTFVLNQDSTISPSKAPNLVLGMDLPDVTLVNAFSVNALVFDRVNELESGTAVPLTLSSHPGYAVCAQSNPQFIDQWKISYQRLGVGDAQYAMIFKKEDNFLVSVISSSMDFVLDIPFDKRIEGTDGHSLSVIHQGYGKTKDKSKNARRFIINKNNTISPVASPQLVVGIRKGTDPSIVKLQEEEVLNAVPVAVPVAAVPVAAVLVTAFDELKLQL